MNNDKLVSAIKKVSADRAIKKLIAKKEKASTRQKVCSQIKKIDNQTYYYLKMPDERPFKYYDVMVERPCIRTVSVQKLNGIVNYKLRFPWVVFIQKQLDYKMAFCLEEPKDIQSPIYFPPLPNVLKNLSVCMPRFGKYPKNVKQFADSFWGSVFHTDAPFHYGDIVRYGWLNSWWFWELQSKKDFKMWLPKVKYGSSSQTIQSLLLRDKVFNRPSIMPSLFHLIRTPFRWLKALIY